MASRRLWWARLAALVAATTLTAAPASATEPGAATQVAEDEGLVEAERLTREAVLLRENSGDYTRAEQMLRRALTLLEDAFGPEHPDVATCLDQLAWVYHYRRDYAGAESLFQRALAIREKALGPEHADVAASLDNLGSLYLHGNALARAEPLLRRALTIRMAALGSQHPDVATTLENLALLYHRGEELARAEPLYRRALAIRERALGPEHPLFASSLNNLAVLVQDKGDMARAEPLYQRALAIWESTLGPDHPRVALVLSNLAIVQAKRGDPAAVSAAARAADIQDRHVAAILAGGSEEQNARYLAAEFAETNRAVAFHVEHAPSRPDAVRLALTSILRRKGRVLDALADSFAILRSRSAPGDGILLDQLASVYSRIAGQAAAGPGRITFPDEQESLAALEQRRRDLEANLGRRSAEFRSTQQLISLSQVQASLPEGAALVEVYRHRADTFTSTRGDMQFVAPNYLDHYLAYVLHRHGSPTYVDLGDAGTIDDAVEALRGAMADPDASRDPRPAARALDALIMQPIRGLLGDTRWVFISPDGPLHLVPFAALIDEDDHSLVERYLFTYLTTGRDLLRFAASSPPQQPALLLANPAFDDTAAAGLPGASAAPRENRRSVALAELRATPAPGTEAEANAIRALFPDAQLLVGAAATETSLKASHAPLFVHVATHGFFLPGEPPVDMDLYERGRAPAAANPAAHRSEDPLLRSGIALAGFNARKSGPDDGVLTALEVAGLDLHGTRLAVLATCDSGLGDVTSGEGVYGLRRALVLAGAQTQVISLWPVLSGPTRDLMTAYYTRLKAGAGRSEAMRDVQLAMLGDSDTAHPNRWASFIVSGDWRSLEGAPVLPRVQPGPRGCACSNAGDTGHPSGAWLAAIGALLTLARVRSRRPPWHHARSPLPAPRLRSRSASSGSA